MDIAVPVPLGLTQFILAEWIQGWKQTIKPNIWRAKMFGFLLGTFDFFTFILKIHFSVRPVFHGGSVL